MPSSTLGLVGLRLVAIHLKRPRRIIGALKIPQRLYYLSTSDSNVRHEFLKGRTRIAREQHQVFAVAPINADFYLYQIQEVVVDRVGASPVLIKLVRKLTNIFN